MPAMFVSGEFVAASTLLWRHGHCGPLSLPRAKTARPLWLFGLVLCQDTRCQAQELVAPSCMQHALRSMLQLSSDERAIDEPCGRPQVS